MSDRPLEVCRHEAAHVVVGVALGLRLRKAVIGREGDALGYAWFTNHGSNMAHAIMFAAGVAWDRLCNEGNSSEDAKLCRELVADDVTARTCVRVATVMLAGLLPAHARVTEALLEKDLNAKDIAKLARGERLESE